MLECGTVGVEISLAIALYFYSVQFDQICNNTNYWYICRNAFQMNKNTSISLGNYFDQFVHDQIGEGRFKNVSEVIRAGLRLLEEEESKVQALKMAIQEGVDSGIAHDFDPKKHLESLKAKRHSNG